MDEELTDNRTVDASTGFHSAVIGVEPRRLTPYLMRIGARDGGREPRGVVASSAERSKPIGMYPNPSDSVGEIVRELDGVGGKVEGVV